MTGYCKDCKYRETDPQRRVCNNVNITDCGYIEKSDHGTLKDSKLIYSYDEGGGFSVGDYFGCVHWEKK